MATLGLSKLISDIQAKYTSAQGAIPSRLFLKSNGGTIVDKSINQATVSLFGNTTTSTVQTKYQSHSIFFDGTGDYLTVPASTSLFDFSADFTIEGWVWKSADGINSYDGFVSYGIGSSATDGLFIEASATRGVTLVVGNVGVVLSDNQSPNTSSWIHIAVTREGNTTRIFQNGILTASTTSGYSVPSTATIFQVGRCEALYTFNGYMEDVRVVCGTALYTSNFTPPTESLLVEEPSAALTNLYNLTNKVSSGYKVNKLPPAASKQFGSILRVDDTYYATNGSDWNTISLADSDYVRYVGENGGFVYGGGNLVAITDIEYYPFASTTNMTLIGDQTTAKGYNSGFADKSNGNSYLAGGYGRWPTPSNPLRSDDIDKHANASSNFTMTNAGNLQLVTIRNAGVVDAKTDQGYLHLGGAGSPAVYQTRIDKFAFASNTPVTISPNVANTNATGGNTVGITDYTNYKGYFRGVFAAETDLEFLPFSSGTPVTTTTITSPNPFGPPVAPANNDNGGVGMSSQTDAYCAIHAVYSGSYSTVEKFPLSSVTPATISTIPGIFDYQTGKAPSAGAVSGTEGFMQGVTGRPNPSATIPQSYLTKFPFAADTFTTTFGDANIVDQGPGTARAGFKTGSHW